MGQWDPRTEKHTKAQKPFRRRKEPLKTEEGKCIMEDFREEATPNQSFE